MPRRATSTPVRIHITLTEAQATLLSDLLHDPRTGKPKFGARAHLIGQLINRFLIAAREDRTSIPVRDLFHLCK